MKKLRLWRSECPHQGGTARRATIWKQVQFQGLNSSTFCIIPRDIYYTDLCLFTIYHCIVYFEVCLTKGQRPWGGLGSLTKIHDWLLVQVLRAASPYSPLVKLTPKQQLCRVHQQDLVWVKLCWPQKDTLKSYDQVPQNVILFEDSVFTEVIKFKWGQECGSNSTDVLIKRGKLDTDTHREWPLKIKTEIRVVLLQAIEHQSWGTEIHEAELSPMALKGNQPCWHLDCRLPASRR